MANSAQLEREAEQTRSQLAQALDELRERITPGQLVDQAVDYAKDSGGGMFVRNLGRQATANPLPIALIGAGVAWLMLSNGRQQSRTASINRAAETAIDRARRTMNEAGAQVGEFAEKTGAQAKDFAQDMSQRASDWVADSKGRVTDAGERFRESMDATRRSGAQSTGEAMATAGEATSFIGDRVSSAYQSAASSASKAHGRVTDQARDASSTMANTVSGLGQRTAVASRDFLQFCRTQPLVLAGLGMALGAVIGALIPPTETEDQLMGQTSDRLKDQAADVAEEQYERAKDIAQTGLEQVETKAVATQSSEHPETSLVPGAEHSASNEPVE
jgi:ElaB/YqjD/DUF883 family membrane-anchored ribosome-binding protein